jgi:hypothetical protein
VRLGGEDHLFDVPRWSAQAPGRSGTRRQAILDQTAQPSAQLRCQGHLAPS